ncbi:MAG: hypothetical protein KDK38_01720 [Leptospiraceae bacterium]|nr:hypothetical protein [Leptospiraceae bacterium]
MRSFSLESTSPEQFVRKLQKLIGLSKLKGIATFELKENHVVLTMNSLGTSTITYDVETIGEGFHALRPKEKIAFTHFALKGQVENWFYEKIQSLGGQFDR